MRRLNIILLISFISLAIFSTAKLETALASQTVVINQHDNGKTIHLHPGDSVQVELMTTGQPGYDWHLDDFNTKYLDKISSGHDHNNPPNQIGSPITRVWRFRALIPGSTEINVKYYQSYDGKQRITDQFKAGVIIDQ